MSRHVGSNPTFSATSSRTSYRSRRRFLFQSNRHLSFTPSLLLSESNPLARKRHSASARRQRLRRRRTSIRFFGAWRCRYLSCLAFTRCRERSIVRGNFFLKNRLSLILSRHLSKNAHLSGKCAFLSARSRAAGFSLHNAFPQHVLLPVRIGCTSLTREGSPWHMRTRKIRRCAGRTR